MLYQQVASGSVDHEGRRVLQRPREAPRVDRIGVCGVRRANFNALGGVLSHRHAEYGGRKGRRLIDVLQFDNYVTLTPLAVTVGRAKGEGQRRRDLVVQCRTRLHLNLALAGDLERPCTRATDDSGDQRAGHVRVCDFDDAAHRGATSGVL